MIHDRKEEYLAHALSFTQQERGLVKKYASWLPEEIIDCHAHCNLPEHVSSMEEKTYNHMLSTFPSYTLDESHGVKECLFPGKKLQTLRFALTFRGIDHRKANQYLLEKSPLDDRIALFGLPEDISYTNEMLHHPRVSALKMYYSYVEPTATTVYEYFKPKILAVAEQLGIPIILHPPKVITACKEDLQRLVRDFPRLKISIAHLGLSKMLVTGLEEAFKELAPYPNIFLDTALNPSVDVVALALQVFGEDRIMYGSDEPLHLIRSRVYIHPTKGQRLITEYPYHWVDSEEHSAYKHTAQGAVHAHWLCMDALHAVIESLEVAHRDRVKRKVLYENAKRFFRF